MANDESKIFGLDDENPPSIACRILSRLISRAQKYTNDLMDVHAACISASNKVDKVICECAPELQSFSEIFNYKRRKYDFDYNFVFTNLKKGWYIDQYVTENINLFDCIEYIIWDFMTHTIKLLTVINKMKELVATLELILIYEKNADFTNIGDVNDMNKHLYFVRDIEFDFLRSAKNLCSVGKFIDTCINDKWSYTKQKIDQDSEKIKIIINTFTNFHNEIQIIQQSLDKHIKSILTLIPPIGQLHERIKILSEGHTQALKTGQIIHKVLISTLEE